MTTTERHWTKGKTEAEVAAVCLYVGTKAEPVKPLVLSLQVAGLARDVILNRRPRSPLTAYFDAYKGRLGDLVRLPKGFDEKAAIVTSSFETTLGVEKGTNFYCFVVELHRLRCQLRNARDRERYKSRRKTRSINKTVI